MKTLIFLLLFIPTFAFSQSDPIITIAKYGERRDAPTSVEMDILVFNYNDGVKLKLSMIRWQIYMYAQVLSNPRLEQLNPIFNDYDQFIKVVGNIATITLVANKKDVTTLPYGYFTLGVLKFDRTLNGLPISYGLQPNSFLSLMDLAIQQMIF